MSSNPTCGPVSPPGFWPGAVGQCLYPLVEKKLQPERTKEFARGPGPPEGLQGNMCAQKGELGSLAP